MKQLIVGLGNPGDRYHLTRHNVGFLVVEAWAELKNLKWQDKPAWNVQIAEITPEIWLVKPTTFMNDSGRAVAAMARYYDLKSDQICVVVDDRDLPFGVVRWRNRIQTGAHHNGLRSILKEYGSVKRLRIGIANDIMHRKPLKDFVLDKFNSVERQQLGEIIETAITMLRGNSR